MQGRAYTPSQSWSHDPELRPRNSTRNFTRGFTGASHGFIGLSAERPAARSGFLHLLVVFIYNTTQKGCVGPAVVPAISALKGVNPAEPEALRASM
jgi:hypothetical protein